MSDKHTEIKIKKEGTRGILSFDFDNSKSVEIRSNSIFATVNNPEHCDLLVESFNNYRQVKQLNAELVKKVEDLELTKYVFKQARKHMMLKEGESIERRHDELVEELKCTERYLEFTDKGLDWLNENVDNISPEEIKRWVLNHKEMILARINRNTTTLTKC